MGKWMKTPLLADDVILTSEAPLGEPAYVAQDAEWCLGQRLFGIRTNKDKLYGRFLFYALQSAEVRHDLLSRATGTTAQGIRQAELRRVRIPLPPLPEQRAIAHILGTLDDKIELNRRMNETLEEMARALFKSWFVDFDPVRAKAALKQHALRGHDAVSDGEPSGNGALRRVDRRTRPRLPGRHGPPDRRPLPRPAGGLGAWGDSGGVGGEGAGSSLIELAGAPPALKRPATGAKHWRFGVWPTGTWVYGTTLQTGGFQALQPSAERVIRVSTYSRGRMGLFPDRHDLLRGPNSCNCGLPFRLLRPTQPPTFPRLRQPDSAVPGLNRHLACHE